MRAAKKRRTVIPPEGAAEVQFAQNRTCCVCRIMGKPFQIHHIDEDPTHHAPSNLALLCLDCHNETQIKGGFGRKLGVAEVVRFRDEWLETVARRRSLADTEHVKLMVTPSVITNTQATGTALGSSAVQGNSKLFETGRPGLELFVELLPVNLSKAYEWARPRWAKGNSAEILETTSEVVATVGQMWVALASFYPEGHFGHGEPLVYFDDFRQQSASRNWLLLQPYGIGQSGTILPLIVASSVLDDSKHLVKVTAHSLLGLSARPSALAEWDRMWEEAAKR